MVRCFQVTVLDRFDDRRANMRRQAYASALDLVKVSLVVEEDREGKRETWRKGVLLTGYLVQYCHYIIDSSIDQATAITKKKK